MSDPLTNRRVVRLPIFLLVWAVALLANCSPSGEAGPITPAAVERPLSVSADGDDEDFDDEEVLVRLAPGVAIETINSRYGTQTIDSEPDERVYLLQTPPGQTLDDVLPAMSGDSDMSAVGPNFLLEAPEAQASSMTFADPSLFSSHYIDQRMLLRIRVPQAHALGRGAGVLVAVLDTGTDPGHPVFAGRLSAAGADFLDGDLNPVDLPDGIDSDADGLTDEAVGHGAFVAGLVLAVAPRASILPIRVLDSDGMGTAFAALQGIEHAVAQGARVINMSFGMPVASGALAEIIAEEGEEGVVFVASAGNQGRSAPSQFPARESDVLSVAATDRRDQKAGFSNYGSWVRVAAPGVGLISAYPRHAYANWSGTSFAAGLVSGEAALLFSVAPDVEGDLVKTAITATAIRVRDRRLRGIGRIDVLAAARWISNAASSDSVDD